VRLPARPVLGQAEGIPRSRSQRGSRVVEAYSPVVGTLAARMAGRGSPRSQLAAGKLAHQVVVAVRQQEQRGKKVVQLERRALRRIDLGVSMPLSQHPRHCHTVPSSSCR